MPYSFLRKSLSEPRTFQLAVAFMFCLEPRIVCLRRNRVGSPSRQTSPSFEDALGSGPAGIAAEAKMRPRLHYSDLKGAAAGPSRGNCH